MSFEQKKSLRTTLEINGCREQSHPGANSHPWPEEDGLCKENGAALFSDAPGTRGETARTVTRARERRCPREGSLPGTDSVEL